MALLVGGAIMSFASNDETIVYTGIGFGAAGAVGLLASMPILSIGYKERKNTCSVFNNKCGDNRAEAPIRFDLTMGPRSLGMAINF